MSKYQPIGDFALRSPLYPIEKIRNLTSGKTISEEDFKAICSDAVVREALYLASPAFYSEVCKWLDGEKIGAKDLDKLMRGAYKYISRMCTRCTPFGMFAGITTGSEAEKTEMKVNSGNDLHIHLRLDMNYVCALAHDLASKEEVRKHLLFFPNNSAYPVGDKLRYVEYSINKARRVHTISEVDTSEYLDAILEKAKTGARIEDLAQSIVDEYVAIEDARAFLEEITASQLLVSELESSVSGEDPFKAIADTLSKYREDEAIEDIIEKLDKVWEAICDINASPIGHPVEVYESIKKMLSEYFTTQYDEKFLFQADMRLDTLNFTLDKKVKDEVIETINFLNKISAKNANSNLENFKQKFYEIYEDEQIPLSLVLDTDAGIGYIQGKNNVITPLVDDIVTPVVQGSNLSITMSPFNLFMRKKFEEAIKSGAEVIELKDEDFKGESDIKDLPETLPVMIRLFNDGTFSLGSAGGSCAANLLGRFCHMCEGVKDITKAIIEKDEVDPDCIYAEIVHLPESRVGNILHRPVLREYEIPYLASSSLPEEKQIPLDDLLVSVENNRIVLKSAKYNKRIIPRLTTAHNYSFGSLPVYNFLCDMQAYEVKSGVYFSWGYLDSMEEFLPRVTYKNAILAPKSWSIYSTNMEEIKKAKSDAEMIETFRKIADKLHICDEVVLVDSDNELYVNLKNDFSVHTLLELVKKRGSFKLNEFGFGSTEERTNELLMAFYKDKEGEA